MENTKVKAKGLMGGILNRKLNIMQNEKEANSRNNWEELKGLSICRNESSTKAKGYKRDSDW